MRCAVWLDQTVSENESRQLAEHLNLSLLRTDTLSDISDFDAFLCYRDDCLKLLDPSSLKKGGLAVEIEPRPGEQASYPAPKKDLLAQAIGRNTQTVLDATCGWAQDCLAIFRMGYAVTAIERSPLMAALIADGFARLARKEWMRQRGILPPRLLQGNAIELLANWLEPAPDCIYLDPMFPPKRRKSALSKKNMQVLQGLLGQDEDREQLFAAAWQVAGKRVVVKSPDYAASLGGKPTQSVQGKLLRYDVYLK